MTRPLSLEINGRRRTTLVAPHEFLLETLRGLGLTGAKEGCGEGECGSCTVLVDGQPVRACIVFSLAVAGRSVTTVEGLAATDTDLHPVQEAMAAAGAVQCGFCTPGFVVALAALLDHNPDPSDAEIRDALAGNLCRCTGYASIMAAARQAARITRERRRRETPAGRRLAQHETRP
jgi:aerobic carbon-monoxide dehydrogenase small subunit